MGHSGEVGVYSNGQHSWWPGDGTTPSFCHAIIHICLIKRPSVVDDMMVNLIIVIG